MMECKDALKESGGDIEKAVAILRKKGVVKAAKKASRTTGQGLQQVLDLPRNDKTWAEIIAGLSLQEAVNEDKILAEIKAGLPVRLAGTRVADEMIADFFRIPSGEVNKLRISALNEKEITLIFILKHVSEIQPEALVGQYKNRLS